MFTSIWDFAKSIMHIERLNQKFVNTITVECTMNNKIRELYEKAKSPDHIEFVTRYGTTHRLSSAEEITKFAKLIIEECQQVCMNRTNSAIHQLNHLVKDEAILCSLDIKKHFELDK